MPQIVGRQAPDFALEGVLNGSFHTYRLSDYKGKWVILFFLSARLHRSSVRPRSSRSRTASVSSRSSVPRC